MILLHIWHEKPHVSPSCKARIRISGNEELFSWFSDVVATADPAEAFKDIDAAFLVGAMPRKEGMERKDLLAANVKIFKAQVRFVSWIGNFYEASLASSLCNSLYFL